MAAVSLDVEWYSAFINFFHKSTFYTNISILAAVSHDDERAAPSSIFSDEIDCNKFISISKATKEKKLFLEMQNCTVMVVDWSSVRSLGQLVLPFFPIPRGKCIE